MRNKLFILMCCCLAMGFGMGSEVFYTKENPIVATAIFWCSLLCWFVFALPAMSKLNTIFKDDDTKKETDKPI